MLLSSSDTKRTLMHLFLFTNSAQRELVSIYVRRVYATAINFPCIITLDETTFCLHCSLQPAVQMFFCKQMTLGLLLRVSAKMFKNPWKLVSLQNLQNLISFGWIFGPLHVFIFQIWFYNSWFQIFKYLGHCKNVHFASTKGCTP